MKKLMITGVGVCLCLFITVNLFGYKYGGWQLWNRESMEGELFKNWKLVLDQEFRFNNDMQDFSYKHTETALSWKTLDWLNLSLNYRHIHELKKDVKLKKNIWKVECQPNVNVTVKLDTKFVKIEDRNRAEYRYLESYADVWRYRNRLSIIFPLKLNNIDIQPYTANELFYTFNSDEFNANRLYVGLKGGFIKQIELDLAYFWYLSKKTNIWTGYDVLDLKIRVKF